MMSLASRWKRLSHFWRHAAINLLLGCLIEILIHVFHDAPVVQRAENAGLDAAIAFFGARGGSGDPKPGLAFTVFDIDEPTWRGWQSPNLTPRDKLLRMLRSATSSKAAAVVVDLDLTAREAANGLTPGSGDSALAGFLAGYRGPVPLVLARLLEYPISDGSAEPLPRPAGAWFEPLPDSAARWIHWGTVQFVQEVDGMVRRWRLWEPVCIEDKPSVLPSIQLMTGAVLDPRDAPTERAPASCHEGHDAGSESHLPERIIYSLPWPPESGPTRMVLLADGSAVPALVRIPAGQVTEGADTIDPRLLDGRIVVIGGSYAASRDWYSTPLGRMPGMNIVVNAIQSLRAHGEAREPSPVLKWVVMLTLLLLASLAYARYDPFVATLLIIPLIYVAVLPISFFLFQSGVWLDFTAPVLGAQLHELVANAEDSWARRGKRFPEHP